MTRQAPLDQVSIQYVKGVGPARAAQLQRLGIQSVADALVAVPRRYEDRSRFSPIHALLPGQLATLRARVLTKSLRRIRDGRTLLEAAMGDASGILECRWFNQPYLAKLLNVNDEFVLYGRIEAGPTRRAARLQCIHPELERVEADADDELLHTGRIVPIYPLTGGVSQRWFRGLIWSVLLRYASMVSDVVPAAIRQRHQLPPAGWAREQIHFPDTWETLAQARRSLVYEELFLMQVRLALRRAHLTASRKPQRYQLEGPVTAALLKALPFFLTASQRAVLHELTADLSQPFPMLRLLQGDVGCGKTVLAALVIAMAVQSGYQAAVMVPTELLAEQHDRLLRGYFEPLGIRVARVSQAVHPSTRKRLAHEIAHGAVHVIIGTHALLERAITFHRLALVVIDEQHKFGVTQRTVLAHKAKAPDVLVMTATPIPRTLALSLYGDLACSTIAEMPPGRIPVQTLLLPESKREEVYHLIHEELRQGRQGYIVYPLVEPSSEKGQGGLAPPLNPQPTTAGVDVSNRQELKAATQMARHLKAEVFPEIAVGLLHGQMRPAEKETVMRTFVEGRIRLLVSTVIVEVGLDVANATVMVIEHPERFGLAQLHQLRGRIGRGTQPARCFLISDATDDLVRKRLTVFAETVDGFLLAEHDLQLRGPGELFGRSQSGILQVRIADLSRDGELLHLAREEAAFLVARDPRMAHPDLAHLSQRLGGL
ncbi:MAG: ATP-dependent DNA helicase RecG, partial [Candidatus Omnitrophica bacterium]|nr:ATP-dependent DNA helicase RecG [Candidatus Omnitrophota bacterium]